ncbi:hypothetical protein [Streptomyces griseocarneus]|uniref:hypothetical protein n=1 Tax=Streptomyces griseocarneus TaxID=51201 RepID=UPI00167D4F15|nr:hypothetical protein [Streptomyces griseocarneus]MBZ6473219.1 hypothetical protein [Streptomyces griseocarneus]GHG60514.1 hypothetical protein GCM10018779_27890 [Streptomyces griseocarneus]
MPNRTMKWFDSLTNSVFALGAAARETRLALQAAQVAAWNIEPARLQFVDGSLRATDGYKVHPHGVALGKIRDLRMTHERSTAALYENTARAYAYGAASAALAVIRGERPGHVELECSETGQYVIPGCLLPDLREGLSRWVGNERLAVLRSDVIARERAWEPAPFATLDLDEHEVAAVAGPLDVTAGLADSSYAYGEQAESALHFLITSARRRSTSEEKQ